MRLPFKPKKRKKKFKWLYKLRNYNGVITRAGITANPLEMYNPVALTTVPNNTLVKHGGLDFVGGDTDTIEYDFFTKVAGSTVECPMRITWYPTSTLCTPSNIADDVIQANIDKIKIQDGTSWTPTATLNGQIQQILVEVDLTPLANVVGGNNSLKSLLKSINVDVWAMGSGANSGVSANGVQVAVWHNGGINSWSSVQNGLNVGASISKISYPQSVQTQAWYSDKINANNKIYILINAQYSSDGTIPSSVSLDYLKVTVQLNRSPDVVSPISVKLPRYFAVVIKGFSPCWDNTYSKAVSVFTIGDSTNNCQIYWSGGKFYFYKKINSTLVFGTPSNSQTFEKNRVYNFIYEQNSTGVVFRLLKNNGTVEKYSNSDTQQFSVNTNLLLNLLSASFVNNTQGDAFLDNLTLIDLEKLGKNTGFSDAEATAILNGTVSGWENPELFDINQVTLHANASRNNGVITLNANVDDSTSNMMIPVLPNNRYEIKCIVTGYISSIVKPYVIPVLLYNNIALGYGYGSSSFTNNGSYTIQFTTPQNCNKIELRCGNKGAGTFTYQNISLKRKD